MVTIDKEKCLGCGECSRVCAGLVLDMEYGFPKYAGRGCIECGHCESVCPSAAIALYPALPLRAESASELEKKLLSRRSTRHYKSETPGRADIENALNKAQWAPNSKNQQQNGWSVILGKDKVDALLAAALDWCRANGTNRGMLRLCDSGINLVTCGAPCLIIAWMPEAAANHELDCAIAMTYAELMLRERGLATCWGGFATRLISSAPELLALAGVPEGARACCALMVGEADEHYERIPSRPAAKIVWRD